MIKRLLLPIWRLMKGKSRWWALWLWHHKFIVAVCGVILNADNQVLLLRHSFWPKNSWGLPGGYVEAGETLEQGLTRELREETGIEISGPQLIRINSGFQLRMEVCYLARVAGGDQRLDSAEVMEARYFPLDSLPAGLLESDREIVQLARGLLVGTLPGQMEESSEKQKR